MYEGWLTVFADSEDSVCVEMRLHDCGAKCHIRVGSGNPIVMHHDVLFSGHFRGPGVISIYLGV